MLRIIGSEDVATEAKQIRAKSVENLPVQQSLTYRISRVHAKLNAQATHLLSKAGLSLAQWRIMALIAIAGETTPVAISRTGAIDKGLLSRKLRGLIDDGLVVARRDPSDHRQQVISLSEAGQAIFEEMLPTMRQRQAHLLNTLTDQEERALFTALEKISSAAERRQF